MSAHAAVQCGAPIVNRSVQAQLPAHLLPVALQLCAAFLPYIFTLCRYEWRASAEFAKAAMHQQTLRGCDTMGQCMQLGGRRLPSSVQWLHRLACSLRLQAQPGAAAPNLRRCIEPCCLLLCALHRCWAAVGGNDEQLETYSLC